MLPKKPEGRLRYLDVDELGRLLARAGRPATPTLAAIVTLAVHTGMRKGEILGLEWERVDLSSARITLYRTKSGKPRGVPINRAVYDALIALEPDPATPARAGCSAARRRSPGGPDPAAFETALTKAGITGFRFHDLRHTAASHLVMRGASLKDVQEILGHADMKMTQRYAHLEPGPSPGGRGTTGRVDGAMTAASAHESAQSTPSVDTHPVTSENHCAPP